MRELHVFESVTLDGVMQASSAPEDGFAHGGWFGPYNDAVTMEPGTAGPGELLFGRRTFEEMERGWRHGPADNPFTAIMNDSPKYVASRTLTGPLDWNNSHLLAGEAVETVARLKQADGPGLTLLGSGSLARSLLDAGLVDGVTLLITPLVLGSGMRLLEPGGPYTKLDLVSSKASGSGVIVASYRVAR